jgi:hypothetical protein
MKENKIRKLLQVLLLQVVIKVLVPLSMWSMVQFLHYAYRENLVGRGEPILYAPHAF